MWNHHHHHHPMFMQRRGCNIARSYFHEIAETCKLIAAIAGNALAIITEKVWRQKTYMRWQWSYGRRKYTIERVWEIANGKYTRQSMNLRWKCERFRDEMQIESMIVIESMNISYENAGEILEDRESMRYESANWKFEIWECKPGHKVVLKVTSSWIKA